MEKIIAVCKNGTPQASFRLDVKNKNKKEKEFLGNREVRRVLRIEHKPMCLIAN